MCDTPEDCEDGRGGDENNFAGLELGIEEVGDGGSVL